MSGGRLRVELNSAVSGCFVLCLEETGEVSQRRFTFQLKNDTGSKFMLTHVSKGIRRTT